MNIGLLHQILSNQGSSLMSDKLSRVILALDRKKYRFITGLLTGHCMLKWQVYIMSLLESAICRKVNPPTV